MIKKYYTQLQTEKTRPNEVNLVLLVNGRDATLMSSQANRYGLCTLMPIQTLSLASKENTPTKKIIQDAGLAHANLGMPLFVVSCICEIISYILSINLLPHDRVLTKCLYLIFQQRYVLTFHLLLFLKLLKS